MEKDSKVKRIKAEMIAKIHAQTDKNLCEMYEILNDSQDPGAPGVREMIIDELEARNPTAFNKWMESDEIEEIDKPSLFFI